MPPGQQLVGYLLTGHVSPLVSAKAFCYTVSVLNASAIFKIQSTIGPATVLHLVPKRYICRRMNKKLADYLARKGLNPAQFAALIGVSQVAVHRYLHMQRTPHRRVMAKIIEVTGGKVTADDFYEADVKNRRQKAA